MTSERWTQAKHAAFVLFLLAALDNKECQQTVYKAQ